MAAVLAIWAVVTGCRPATVVEPSIQFTRLPPAGEGTPFKVDAIEGRVTGAKPDQRIVLFAKAGVWWVQPFSEQPFTKIVDSQWKSTTHPGTAYAALLVTPDFKPQPTVHLLPDKGGSVLAVALADSDSLIHPVPKTLRFSGYEWDLRQLPSNPGGTRNLYDPSNVSVDAKGYLHLRITKRANQWISSEVTLSRGLGYGSYRFVVEDVSHLEPAAVLNLCVRDDSAPPREMDIETSRWGEATSKNAQYVIQPFYVPANVLRFMAPPGPLTYSFSWDPGRALFSTARRLPSGETSSLICRHVFTSGIPMPGSDSVHLNLYRFENRDNPLKHEVEIVVEKFEYLP